MDVQGTAVRLPSPSETPSQLEIRPLPGLGVGCGGRLVARTAHPERGAPAPGSPGVAEVRPRRRKGKEKPASGPGSRARSRSTGHSSGDRAAGKSHRELAVAAARAPVAPAASARPSPRRSPALPCRCPQSGPRSPRPSVGSRELRRQDERDVPVAGTGSQRREAKDSREEPRRLRPLPLRMPPIPRGRRCRRGRVLGIAAPGAQRSPLARRLSGGTRRAGAARLGWSPAPGCMLIRWGGGVPRFLRPTAGAGGRVTAEARSPRSHPPRLLRCGHQPWPRPGTCARAAGRRPASCG